MRRPMSQNRTRGRSDAIQLACQSERRTLGYFRVLLDYVSQSGDNVCTRIVREDDVYAPRVHAVSHVVLSLSLS